MDDATPMADIESRAARPAAAARPWRVLVAAGLLGVLLVTSLGGLTLSWQGSTSGGLTLVIPEGAAARLALPTIDSAIAVPTALTFERGDVLTIRNEDSAANRAGPWVLAAGETLRMRFDTPGEYAYLCAIDEAESVTVTVVDPSPPG